MSTSTNPTMQTLVAQLTAAIGARKHSLIALRGRVADLLKPIPIGTVLSDETGEVCRIIRVCPGASQWGTRTWDVTIHGRGALSAEGKVLCEDLACSHWDGTNMHHRSSEPTCRYAHGAVGERIAYEPGTRTRALAARLPVAIATYIGTCETERAANDAATVQL